MNRKRNRPTREKMPKIYDCGTLHVGDVVIRTPVTLGDTDRGVGNTTAPPMRGRVVYIHPKGRFHTVEFADGHEPVRESFCGVRR